MKTLTRSELKTINGGTIILEQCGWVQCTCDAYCGVTRRLVVGNRKWSDAAVDFAEYCAPSDQVSGFCWYI